MTHSADPISVELAALQREGFAVDPAPSQRGPADDAHDDDWADED